MGMADSAKTGENARWRSRTVRAHIPALKDLIMFKSENFHYLKILIKIHFLRLSFLH